MVCYNVIRTLNLPTERKIIMTSKSIRAICALLAVLTAVSCGSAAGTPETGNTDTTNEETTAPEDTALTDDVPPLDFEGREFRTVEQTSVMYGFAPEEQNGDIINDAVYERARKAEERFNITITPTVYEDYNTISSVVKQSVMSGDQVYDLVFGQMYQSGSDAQSGVFADWNDIPYVDFSKPWYVKSLNDAMVGGKLYMIESELSISYFQQTWMILYNKTKAEEISGFPDLYKAVEDGTWTLDELNSLTSDVYRDTNGDTKRDAEDFYGFAGTSAGCLLAAFLYGADGRVAKVDGDHVEHLITSEKTLDVLGKLSKLFCSNSGTITKTDALSKTRRELFPKGVVLFEAMQVNDLLREDFGLRNMSDEFGVLPLPKYDEKQKEYYTVVDGGASVMVVPANHDNTGMVGAVVEAMSAMSYTDVIPKYIGMAVEQKGTRDEESIKIMREILDSRVMDFAYLYDGFKGWVMNLTEIIKNESAISSTIEKKKSAMDSYYNSVIEVLRSEE